MNTSLNLAADTAAPERMAEPALELRLTSNELAHTPGIVAWTLAGYRAAKRNDDHVGPFIAVLSDGYDLGAVIAERVLRGDIVHRVEGDDVVLCLGELDADTYESRHRRIDHDVVVCLGELDAVTYDNRHRRIDRHNEGELPF